MEYLPDSRLLVSAGNSGEWGLGYVENGKFVKKHALGDEFFSESSTYNSKQHTIVQLTWKEQVAYEYDQDCKRVGDNPYASIYQANQVVHHERHGARFAHAKAYDFTPLVETIEDPNIDVRNGIAHVASDRFLMTGKYLAAWIHIR